MAFPYLRHRIYRAHTRLPLLPLATMAVALSLVGCATLHSESLAYGSPAVPAQGYHNILVFVHNDAEDRLRFEKDLLTDLRKIGINATSGFALFSFTPSEFSRREKRKMALNLNVDAYLDVRVVRIGLVETPVLNASYRETGGGPQICRTEIIISYCLPMPDWDRITRDGIVKRMWIFNAEAQLKDILHRKIVWEGAIDLSLDSGNNEGISVLFRDMAQQIAKHIKGVNAQAQAEGS